MRERSVGIIGVGLMGAALSRRLLDASWMVTGYDTNPARCEELARLGGRVAGNHAEVAACADRLLLSLPTADHVEDVLRQIRDALRPGQIIVDTTTGDPQKMAAIGSDLSARGIEYLDAEISGSSADAARGEAIVMAGGSVQAFAACTPLLACFTKHQFHVGPWGSGARMKLVTNLVLGLNRAALAEGLALARAMELDAGTTLAILMQSAAYSRAMDAKGRKMIAGDFVPQAKLSQHLKDVRLILAAGSRVGARLPLSALHCRLLTELVAEGYGDLDNSAVMLHFGVRSCSKTPADGS